VITSTNEHILDMILYEEIAFLIFTGDLIVQTTTKYFIASISSKEKNKPPG